MACGAGGAAAGAGGAAGGAAAGGGGGGGVATPFYAMCPPTPCHIPQQHHNATTCTRIFLAPTAAAPDTPHSRHAPPSLDMIAHIDVDCFFAQVERLPAPNFTTAFPSHSAAGRGSAPVAPRPPHRRAAEHGGCCREL
jgi:hypothetical protein